MSENAELNLGVVKSHGGKTHLLYGPNREGNFYSVCRSDEEVYLGGECWGIHRIIGEDLFGGKASKP